MPQHSESLEQELLAIKCQLGEPAAFDALVVWLASRTVGKQRQDDTDIDGSLVDHCAAEESAGLQLHAVDAMFDTLSINLRIRAT